jgi:hypothetical protein
VTSPGPSPLLRGGLLLFSIVVVGGLIGFGWEMGLHEDTEAEDELESMVPGEGPLAVGPDWRKGPSEMDREIVQRATAGLPAYKDAVPQALAADYLGEGSNLAAAWFMTQDSPDEVLKYYREELLKAGLPPVEHRYNPLAGYVAYMEVESKRVHTVSVLEQGGETMVFISAGQVTPFLEAQGRVPAGLPMPERLVQPPVVLTFRHEGRIQYSIMAEVEEGKADVLYDFYRESFGAQGWTLEQGSEQAGDAMQLQVTRGTSRASALVQQKGVGVSVYLTLDQPL